MRHAFNMLEDAARRYAAANRSDPFAYNRAMTHITCGMAVGKYEDGRFVPDYDAEPIADKRITQKGEAYNVTVYINQRRM